MHPMNWVGDWVGSRARLSPDRIAVIDIDSYEEFTYREMNRRAFLIAQWLDNQGLKKGDRISVVSPNCVELLDLYHACGKTGIILCPLSFRLKAAEIADLVDRINPKMILFNPDFEPLLSEITERKPSYNIYDSQWRNDVYHAELTKLINEPLVLDDLFMCIHTGGTTSIPKVCLISHQQMLFNSMELLANQASTGSSGNYLLNFPMFHIGGWNTVTPIIHTGGTVLVSSEFNPGKILGAIERYKVSFFGGVEVMLRMISGHPAFEKTDLSSLMGIVTAAAPCKPEACEPFWNRGIPTFHAYGLTEAGPSNCFYIPQSSNPDDVIDEVKAKPTSPGRPLFHSDYKILDKDSGEPVGVGKIGMLYLRSLHNFSGYLNDDYRTEKMMDQDGWVKTGDLAIQDEYGDLTICGRADFMFISGGENISPEEIEQALVKHPMIIDALSVGVPDENWGQIPVCGIVFRNGEVPDLKAIREHCQQYIADYKLPRDMKVLDALPVTAVGKPDRAALRAMFEGE